ncbi:uracil-DNA glycosylase family protein [Sphingomonas sp.]|uniref:uracil-DNA glycosylase family protein n=1 Tax=Sphingomonas sp. TaxID=28214 RepID=UPI001ECE8060|nr:uracil-DNA glycosylase family protein [Sphingomonas sp.]MBX3595117.1 uracil-DNA glycosylase [Sphingomonas sp.]
MGMAGVIDWRAEAASALEWWRDAGVDMLIDDLPRDWTAREIPSGAARTETPAPLAEPEDVPLPATLEAFIDWRFGTAAPEAVWGEPIFTPQGDPAASLMVLIELPEADDRDTLLTGAAGRLFDRILAAIGHDRDSIYLAPFCAARPITGQSPREAHARLAELARHHVALTGPERLLILGQSVSRAFLGTDSPAWRGRLESINYQGGKSATVATYPPRLLLGRPAQKADVWKDLQLLIGGQSS